MRNIKWGIVGLGNIAQKFAEDLALVPEAVLWAVASSDAERAAEFAQKHNVMYHYDTYLALFEDPNVEVVYIASLHPDHVPMALQALQHGKAVLCEKPLGVNAKQVQELLDLAQSRALFLMEALWTRFNPAFEQTLQLIEEDALGPLRYINATFSFNGLDRSLDSRLFNPTKAGGALLDIGIYPLFLAYQLLGMPKDVKASAVLTPQGVDLQLGFVLTYDTAQAILYASFSHNEDMRATICGEKGEIYLPSRWHETDQLHLMQSGKKTTRNCPVTGRGYYYEIIEVHNCLILGQVESKKWTWKNSLELSQLMDQIRQQCGIVYPGETI